MCCLPIFIGEVQYKHCTELFNSADVCCIVGTAYAASAHAIGTKASLAVWIGTFGGNYYYFMLLMHKLLRPTSNVVIFAVSGLPRSLFKILSLEIVSIFQSFILV
jgi:hypothetical protein